jgi:hypothetical protein
MPTRKHRKHKKSRKYKGGNPQEIRARFEESKRMVGCSGCVMMASFILGKIPKARAINLIRDFDDGMTLADASLFGLVDNVEYKDTLDELMMSIQSTKKCIIGFNHAIQGRHVMACFQDTDGQYKLCAPARILDIDVRTYINENVVQEDPSFVICYVN